MNKKEQAKVILEELDKVIQVDWNMEKYYVGAIVNGLNEVDNKRNGEKLHETGTNRNRHFK